MTILEVQTRTEQARQVFFRPLGRSLRGPVDFSSRARSKDDYENARRWPEPIPGEVLGINLETGEKYVREPLYDAAHATTREIITQKRGMKLQPQLTPVESESVTTWLHWIKKGVKAGVLRVIQGEIPPEDKWVGKPRLSFIRNEQKPSTNQLAEAIDRMTSAIELQTKLLARLLEAKK